MSLSPEFKSINCTACGAGLDVLGGGRVTVHICPYCGTALDTLDAYRALSKFNDIDRPETPFSIGTRGRIGDANYTVIGLLQHTEIWQGQRWVWLDHQLYSPTHGYAWLTLEEGHCVFSYRVRSAPWISAAAVETAHRRPFRLWRGSYFLYYDTSASSVTYAEGEFTWLPKKGARATTVTAISETDGGLSFSEHGNEREVVYMRHLTKAEVAAAFSLDPAEFQPRGVHPLQPYEKGRQHDFVKYVAGISAVLCLLIGFILSLMSGTKIYSSGPIAVSALPMTIPLQITDTNSLTRLRLSGDANNSWAYFGIELEDPEGEPLFEAGRTIEYYSGRDADGSWSEGSNSATLTFRPTQAGIYQLSLGLEESGLWRERKQAAVSRPALNRIRVQVQSGLGSGKWLNLLALGFGLIAAVPILSKMFFDKRRWRDSDWTDDD